MKGASCRRKSAIELDMNNCEILGNNKNLK